MKRSVFVSKFESNKVFSINDVYRFFPNFDKRRLSERKKSWKILSLKRWWWIFSWYSDELPILWSAANIMYTPSYISLQSALKRYWLIPETVIRHLSVTTKKTALYTSSSWVFSYTTIKKELFFGYRLAHQEWSTFLIAEPEKALCDLFYSDTSLRDIDSFEELRVHPFEFRDLINQEKLLNYAKKYPKTVSEAIDSFLLFMRHTIDD